MKLYIAGPMTGYDDFNFDAFNEAAAFLRSEDIDVINPAENFDGRQDLPWQTYLRKAITQVAESDGVILLPGWEDSKGAQLERHIAQELGLVIHEYEFFLQYAAMDQ
jgi:hypothetical protein